MLVFREGAPPLDAGEVHRSAAVADLHAHPGLTAYWLGRDLAKEHRPPAHGYNPLRQQLDLPRMVQGGLRVLTACVYAPTIPPFPRPFGAALGAMQFVEDLCARAPDRASLAPQLEQLAARGLRYLTLTHFVHNGLAQPARLGPFSTFRGPPGLTDLGRRVVKKCEELGVLVDLSHCSDRSFADVAAMATRPLLATHTGFRRFHDTERNLSDEQLRTVARSGGVVGVITWSWLLRPRGLVADVEDLADAVVHGALVAGPGHVGIGTDFDGYVWSARRIREARHYPALAEALSHRGFTAAELRGILGGNYLRVLGEA